MDLNAGDNYSDAGSGSDGGEAEAEVSAATNVKKTGRRSAVTGRGVTMQMLIDDKILDAGSKVLSIDYLRQKFEGDLLHDGQIFWNEQVFSSPSAWAMHCKKMVNPEKKSGCGWASVKYKGKKLDQFKSTWFSRQRLAQNSSHSKSTASVSTPKTSKSLDNVDSSKSAETTHDSSGNESPTVPQSISDQVINSQQKLLADANESDATSEKEFGSLPPPVKGPYLTFSEALQVVQNQSSTSVAGSGPQQTFSVNSTKTHLPPPRQYQSQSSGRVYRRKPGRPPKDASKGTSTGMPAPAPVTAGMGRGRGRRGHRTRVSVKHTTVSIDSDPQTLVECCQFSTTGKIQPFSISIATSCLLLMDFHSHLSTNEVLGYLAGKWDSNRLHLQVLQCYPLKFRHGDKGAAEQCENEVRSSIEAQGLLLVGSYHSHPHCQADPSVCDIKNQTAHQSVLRDANNHEPCIGVIVSPYDSYKKETIIKAFWVQTMAEAESTRLGLPLLMKYTTQQDQQLTQNIVNEMVGLVNFYKGCADAVRFTDTWLGETTYLDKIKHSVIRKFPQDQTDGRFLDFIHKMLASVSGLPRPVAEDPVVNS